jgi:putative membrane-bound dehydrogenase-like protein
MPMLTFNLQDFCRMHIRFILSCFAIFAIAFPAAAQHVHGKEPNTGGTMSLESRDPAIALQRLHPQEGYEVSLWASEIDFPLHNPVALVFDARGRLWVSTMPTYPQRLPDEEPNDKILILEDTNNDGKADKHTVFIEGLHLPTGFELGDGGVYISQQPDILFAKDTDGDDRADEVETLLHGFGTEDSHHAIHTFIWGPDGGLYFQEGTFHHSQVETPYGPVRLQDAGIFRYEPWRQHLEVFVSYPFANPWGHVFDRWGQNFIADASGGSNYYGTAITGNAIYPAKRKGMKVFTTVVRPTAGCEFVSSRHFPEEAQGNFLVNNVITFQGIKQHRVIEEGSGYKSEEVAPLLHSDDMNFRPVCLRFGPDGALYIVDWFNPLIGHMQYSLRDERRDHAHGRIWRITAKDRPLLTPPAIEGQTLPALLDLLKTYEDRTRYRARIEIRSNFYPQEIERETDKWVATLDKNDGQYEHHLLEALWVYQTAGIHKPDLLEQMLNAKEPRARAGAVRVLRFWRDQVDNPLGTLERLVNDEFPRVRIEALLALSYIMEPRSAEIAVQVLQHEMDYYLDYVLGETIGTLTPVWKQPLLDGRFQTANLPQAQTYLLDKVATGELTAVPGTEAIYRALLRRKGVSDDIRAKALEGLAQETGGVPVEELVAMIKEADARTPADTQLVRELGRLLLTQAPDKLSARESDLTPLAQSAKNGATRQVAFAALLVMNDKAAAGLANDHPETYLDFIRAVPMVPKTQTRDALLPEMAKILDSPGAAAPAARYVRIELPGNSRTLTLAEVEVLVGNENVARSGNASQSTTYPSADAARAIDGNTGGNFGEGGQSHTEVDGSNPWWELDLGKPQAIDSIRIWNRREGRLGDRLNGYTLKLLDADRKIVFVREGQPAPMESATIAVRDGHRSDLRRAAIDAVASMESKPGERFDLLAGLVSRGEEIEAASAALASVPESAWRKDKVAGVVESLVGFVKTVPTDKLSSSSVQAVFTAGDKLAAAVPGTRGPELRAALASLGIRIVTVRPAPHLMLFEQREIVVKAGQPVEIVFENIDIMPHNLVLTKPGKMEIIGRAAEAGQKDEEMIARQFVPKSDDVLQATRLLNPGETQRLAFIAPAQPGDYPYVCTYPGHWITMNGVMRVVEKLDPAMLAAAPPAAATPVAVRKFVKFYEMDDLKPALERADKGRSFARGRELFEIGGCVRCHAFNGAGDTVGPDLTKVREKYNALGVLEQIMDPSLQIEDAYRAYLVQTKNDFLSGPMVSQDDKTVRLRANPVDLNEVTDIPRADITSLEPSPLSTMPSDLLITFSEDEVLDLIAYLLSGGDANAPAFKP